jgi:hypothetical protein
MSNTLLIKRSAAPGAVPGTANISLGELAINTYDGRLYTKIDTGTASIYELTQNQPIQVLGNVTGNSINSGNGTSNITLTLTTTGVTAGVYGGSVGPTSNIGVFTVDQYGRITSASNVAISTSSLSNGTSNIEIANSANISITVAGTPNVAVFANTGVYVTGLQSVSGNVTAANFNTAGLASVAGNITGGNISTAGNIAAGGILTNNYYYANGSPVDFQQAAGANGEIQFNQGDDFAASANLAFDSANSIFTVIGTSSVSGNITGGNIVTAGNVSATGNISGNNVIAVNAVVGNIDVGNIQVTGNIIVNSVTANTFVSAIGNVTGSNINTAGLVSATGNIVTGANAVVAGYATVTGNITGGNINTAGLASVAGNVIAGNVTTAGQVIATANITGGNVIGNALVQGVTVSASGNVIGGNVSTAGEVTATGNVTGGNINTAGLASVAGNVIGGNLVTAGLATVTGNITGGNLVTAGLATVTGNITGGNLVTAGLVQAGSASVTGNTTSGNLLTGGIVSATGNITGGNVDTAGLITAAGNITGGNVLTGGLVSATGNITGGNLVTSGAAAITGNLSANNAAITNLMSAGQISTSGNVLAGQQVSATGNITGGNIATAGLVTVTGNVTAGNFNTAGLITATGNVTGGNIVTAGVVTTPNINSATSLTVTTGAGDINLWPTSGNIHLANTYINHLANPVQSFDAATKQYVDDAVSTGIVIHTPVYVESPTALAATYAQGGTTHTVTDITGNTTLTFSSAHSLNVNDQIYWAASFNGITANTSYFVFSTPTGTQITLANIYGGPQITNLTNGTGLSQVGRANPGVGATLTANVNGAVVIDGVSLTSSQRVLIYTQTTAYQNGVYVVTDVGNVSAPWIMTRSSDTNTYAPSSINGIDSGDYFYVQAGNTGAGESYVLTAPTGELILGYDALTFTQFSASQVYAAGNGLSLTGTTFSVNVDNNTTAIVGGNVVVKASANLTTPNIGAATGTSLSVTGNIAGANVISTGLLTVTGNIDSGNVNVTGNLSAAGNINGANATITANVVGGNIITAGIVSATSNIIGGNLVTSATANVGTLVVNTFANILATTISVSNITGALRVAGGIGVTGNVYADGMYVLGDSVLTVNSTVDGGTY